MNSLPRSASVLRATVLGALIAVIALPTSLFGQAENGAYPRSELDEQLDALATERAQALNQAYYEYERALEQARQEAATEQEPSLYDERRSELRPELEEKVTRIERRYERRRADIFEERTGERFEGGKAADRFGKRAGEEGAVAHNELLADHPVGGGQGRMERLNHELAQTWADFHQKARALRQRARRDEDWDGYEDALTRLENEYQEKVSDIQRRQRELRFDLERDADEGDDMSD